MSIFAALPSPSQNVLEIGPLTIHVYGILIAIGVIVAIVVSKKRYMRFGGSGDLFESVAIWAVVIDSSVGDHYRSCPSTRRIRAIRDVPSNVSVRVHVEHSDHRANDPVA